MKEKHQIIIDTAYYSVSNFLSMIIGMLTGILRKRLLGPSFEGIWVGLRVILGYGMDIKLGIFNAACRDIPYYIGKQLTDKAAKVQNVAFSFSILLTFISGIGVILYSWIYGHYYSVYVRIGMFCIGLLIVLTTYYNNIIMLLRAYRKIPLLSLIIVLNIIFTAVFPLIFTYLYGIYGLYWTMVIGTFISGMIAHRLSKIKISVCFDIKEYIRLLKIGFPMYIGGLTYSFLLNIDKIMIAKYLGAYPLGLYSVGLMIVGWLSALPKMFNVVVFPRIQETYGKTNDLKTLEKYIVRPTVLMGHLFPIFIGIAVFCLEVLIHYFLNKFTGGITCMKILCAGFIFIILSGQQMNFLFTINKHIMNIPILGFFVGVSALLDYIFIMKGYGINGVALGTGISYLGYFVVISLYSLSHMLEKKQIMLFFAKIFGAYLYGILIYLIAETIDISTNFIFNYLIKCIIFILLSSPLLIISEKNEHIFKDTINILKAKIK